MHKGLKAAINKVFYTTWQRCRVYAMRNLLVLAGRQGRSVVAALIGNAFAREDAASTKPQWRQVADQLRAKAAKLANMVDDMEADGLAYMGLPQAHRAKLPRNNPIHGEITPVTDVVGIFPKEPATRCLIGVILFEQNDDWAVLRGRHMMLATMTGLNHDQSSSRPPWPPD